MTKDKKKNEQGLQFEKYLVVLSPSLRNQLVDTFRKENGSFTRTWVGPKLVKVLQPFIIRLQKGLSYTRNFNAHTPKARRKKITNSSSYRRGYFS